jgi:hypothetical protein
MTETPVKDKAPLDEVMLAMDVVDTLRHRERIVERALSTEDQDRQLVERLREIYAGQGIEVSDAIIERGVRDLREDRFVYEPTPPSFGRSLATLYVTRSRWGKPVAGLVAVTAAVLLSYQMFVRGPELAAIAALPDQLTQAHAAVIDITDAPEIAAQADRFAGEGQLAYARRDYRDVRAAIGELDALSAALQSQYEVRVRQAPGELSGVWRIPDTNENAQNYYLIVEAVDANGNRLTLPITSEEDGTTRRVTRWGQRVDEATFREVASDKGDDGIIQNAVIGEKRRGALEPDFRSGVRDGAITRW